MKRINTYENWLEKEGLPVIRDFSIPDVMFRVSPPFELKKLACLAILLIPTAKSPAPEY